MNPAPGTPERLPLGRAAGSWERRRVLIGTTPAPTPTISSWLALVLVSVAAQLVVNMFEGAVA